MLQVIGCYAEAVPGDILLADAKAGDGCVDLCEAGALGRTAGGPTASHKEWDAAASTQEDAFKRALRIPKQESGQERWPNSMLMKRGSSWRCTDRSVRCWQVRGTCCLSLMMLSEIWRSL